MITRGFAIGYVHSVYHAASAEIFTVDGPRFTMRAIVSTSGGVLDYYAIEGERRHAPGGLWVLILATPATYDELSLIASPVGRRTLIAGGRCQPLFPDRGALDVRLAVQATLDDDSGPCADPYNQSFFLKTVYNPMELTATATADSQNPQG